MVARLLAMIAAFLASSAGAVRSRLVVATSVAAIAAGAFALTPLGQQTADFWSHWESGDVVYHRPYRDPIGILTVCDGHTGPDIVEGRYYSTAECQAIRAQDLLIAEQRLQREVPNWRQIPDKVYAAFTSWTGNLGSRPYSTAVAYLRQGRWRDACNQIPLWVRAGGKVWPGLVKRRITGDDRFPSERDLCLQGVPE